MTDLTERLARALAVMSECPDDWKCFRREAEAVLPVVQRAVLEARLDEFRDAVVLLTSADFTLEQKRQYIPARVKQLERELAAMEAAPRVDRRTGERDTRPYCFCRDLPDCFDGPHRHDRRKALEVKGE